MVGPLWFVGFDSLMEFAAFLIALAIAYQAFKGYGITKERTLLYLQFSFALLSCGLIVDAFAGFVGILARALRFAVGLAWLGYMIYFLTQLLAYSLLIYAYVSQTRDPTKAGTSLGLISLLGFAILQIPPTPASRLLGPMIEYHPVSEIILLFLILYIAVQTGLNYFTKEERNALLVFLGFLLLALSHLLFVLMIFSPLMFVIGHMFQLLGFVALLAMLLRVTKTT